jgi:hypothetical protein
MIKDACKRIGRDISDDEWKKYFVGRPKQPICPDVQPKPGTVAAGQPNPG